MKGEGRCRLATGDVGNVPLGLMGLGFIKGDGWTGGNGGGRRSVSFVNPDPSRPVR